MPDYTDKELLDYIATQKPGSFITAAELQYGFGGLSQYHAGRLKKLVNAGKLEILPGKTRGKGSRYALATGKRKNPRYDWQTPSSYSPSKGRGPVHPCNVCGECDYIPGPRACGARISTKKMNFGEAEEAAHKAMHQVAPSRNRRQVLASMADAAKSDLDLLAFVQKWGQGTLIDTFRKAVSRWKSENDLVSAVTLDDLSSDPGFYYKVVKAASAVSSRNDFCRLPHHHPGDHEGRHTKKRRNPCVVCEGQYDNCFLSENLDEDHQKWLCNEHKEGFTRNPMWEPPSWMTEDCETCGERLGDCHHYSGETLKNELLKRENLREKADLRRNPELPANSDVVKFSEQLRDALEPLFPGRYLSVSARSAFGQSSSVHVRWANITPAMIKHNVAFLNDPYNALLIIQGWNKDGEAGPKISSEMVSTNYRPWMRKKTVKAGKTDLMIRSIVKYVEKLGELPPPRAERRNPYYPVYEGEHRIGWLEASGSHQADEWLGGMRFGPSRESMDKNARKTFQIKDAARPGHGTQPLWRTNPDDDCGTCNEWLENCDCEQPAERYNPGYKILGHDRDNTCENCGGKGWCVDCGICELCDYAHDAKRRNPKRKPSIRVYNIEWEHIDEVPAWLWHSGEPRLRGRDHELPTEVRITLEKGQSEADISDILSKKYGWLVSEYEVDLRKTRRNPEDAQHSPEALAEIFDSLKPKETILVAMKSVMGMSRVTDGNYHEWKVGRRSHSKKYGVTTITLLPMDGSKPSKFARFALRKRRDRVSASHGDMAVMLIGIRRPNPRGWLRRNPKHKDPLIDLFKAAKELGNALRNCSDKDLTSPSFQPPDFSRKNPVTLRWWEEQINTWVVPGIQQASKILPYLAFETKARYGYNFDLKTWNIVPTNFKHSPWEIPVPLESFLASIHSNTAKHAHYLTLTHTRVWPHEIQPFIEKFKHEYRKLDALTANKPRFGLYPNVRDIARKHNIELFDDSGDNPLLDRINPYDDPKLEEFAS